jgi:hypothetical protein
MNKNIILLLLVSLIVISGLCSCTSVSGSGNIITANRETGSFSGLKVSGPFDVEIKQGDKVEVVIKADDNLMDHIETEVRGGILRISTDRHNFSNVHLNVYITVPSLKSITASSSAEIIVNKLTSVEKIALDASSAGEITASLDAPDVSAESSSGGEITLSGRTKDFHASTSSGSSIEALDLLAENSTVSSSSGATAKVYASVLLDANASSGANIYYRGAGQVKKSVSSGAGVEKTN